MSDLVLQNSTLELIFLLSRPFDTSFSYGNCRDGHFIGMYKKNTTNGTGTLESLGFHFSIELNLWKTQVLIVPKPKS